MTITELIAALESFKAEHGDLPVYGPDDECGVLRLVDAGALGRRAVYALDDQDRSLAWHEQVLEAYPEQFEALVLNHS